MAGRQLDVSVLVRLVDRLTSPLSRIAGRIGALGSRIGVLGSVVAAISFAAPIAQAAQWDSNLRGIGITAGLSGTALEEMIDRTSARYQALALQVGQSSRDIAAGAATLVAAGMDPAQIDALLPIIGRVSTAADAAFNDISQTAYALSDGLKVPADQMEQALATLVVAGKAGRFELADMARFFPSLTAQMANLGVTGQEAVTTLAAGLQIAMKGAANPEQAANNMMNFLAKLNSPEVQRNFEKMGVDLSGVMQDAVAKGINPIEAVIEKVTKLTEVSASDIQRAYATVKASGMSDADALAKVEEQVRKIGGAGRLGQLFGDQQVLSFLLPMLANLDSYQRIAAEAGSAGTDSIATDFDSRMAGMEARLKRFMEVGDQLMRRVGAAFAQNLGWISAGLQTFLDALDWIDQMAPGSADLIIAIAGTFAVLAVGLGILAPALGIVSAGLGLIGAVVGLIFSPFILVIAAIAGAAALIMADWKTFAPFFTRLWNGVKNILSGALRAIKSLFSGDFAGVMRGLRLMWEGAKTAAAAGWDILKGMFFSLLERIKAIDWWETGHYALGMLYEGIKFAGSVLASPGKFIADLIRNTDWGNVGQAILDGIVFGIKAYVAAVVDFNSWLANRITSFNWAEVGKTVMTAIWDGMKSMAGEISNWFSDLFPTRKNFMTGEGFGAPAPDASGDATPKKMNLNAPIGGSNGFRQAAAGSATVGGEIVVRAEKGTSATVTRQANSHVPMVADRGLTLGRA